MKRSAFLLALLLLPAPLLAQPQTHIGTTLGPGGAHFDPDFLWMGTTFTIPTGFPSLRMLTFSTTYHWDAVDPYAPTLEIFRWSLGAPTGPALLSTVLDPVPVAHRSDVRWDGNIAVTPGEMYVALLSTNHHFAVGTTGRYDGGAFVRLNDDTWETTTEDAAFRARLFHTTTTPEPATWALLGTGLFGLGLMARRRRKA